MFTHQTKKSDEHESDILLASYRSLNEFLCAFIDQSLPIYNYSIRTRLLFEKILNCEFRVGIPRDLSGRTESLFLIGKWKYQKNFKKNNFLFFNRY
jgi:hypothetical protein